MTVTESSPAGRWKVLTSIPVQIYLLVDLKLLKVMLWQFMPTQGINPALLVQLNDHRRNCPNQRPLG